MFKLLSFQLRAILTRGALLYRAALLAGLGAFAALAAMLVFKAAAGPAGDPTRIARLLAAFNGNYLIELGLFSAVALGYCHWALDMLAGLGAERPHAALRISAEALFVLAVAAAGAALLAWNLALL